MAIETVEQTSPLGNLFISVSNVMLGEVIEEARELARRYPRILALIATDQDRVALVKRQLRREQRMWHRCQTPALPGMAQVPSKAGTARSLQQGRPRMDPGTVLVFFCIAHYFNAIYSTVATERLLDSLSVHDYLMDKGISMPGLRTIGDNVNALGPNTLWMIMSCQAEVVA